MSFFHKKIIHFTCLLFVISMLFGCKTIDHGYGIIIAEQKKDKRYDRQCHMKKQMKHYAKTAGTTGAISGGFLGGSIALWYGMMEGVAIAPIVGGTIASAAAGALTFGLAGIMVGGISGYAIEESNSKLALYQFKVKSLYDNGKIYTIEQYVSPIPLDSKVKILEKHGSLFIKKS